MRPYTRLSENESGCIFSRLSDHHIWNTFTHNKPRAISRDLRLVTDSSRNLKTQFSFRFLIRVFKVGKEKKKRIECMNVANIGTQVLGFDRLCEHYFWHNSSFTSRDQFSEKSTAQEHNLHFFC